MTGILAGTAGASWGTSLLVSSLRPGSNAGEPAAPVCLPVPTPPKPARFPCPLGVPCCLCTALARSRGGAGGFQALPPSSSFAGPC